MIKYEYCWSDASVSNLNTLGDMGWRVVPGMFHPSAAKVLMEREITEFKPIPRGES